MSIWNKVLLGLNILVSLGAFYFALQTLNIHKVWRESAQKHENRIEQVNKEIETIKQGHDGNGGIRGLRMELNAELFDRGRVWYDCKPLTITDPKSINVAVEQPKPHRIDQGTIVYVFEYTKDEEATNNTAVGDMGAIGVDLAEATLKPVHPKIKETTNFLGEFIVTSSVKVGVTISPTMTLDNKTISKLKASKGPWMIRELMPADTHNRFANMPEEELRKLLPPQLVNDYAKDGKDGFVRKLRDYETIVKWQDQRRTKQIEAEEAGIRFNEYLNTSLADSTKQEQYRRELNQTLKQELVAVSSERDTVLAYEASLKRELQNLQQEIDSLMNKNRVLAQTIQEFQHEALMQIDSKTVSAH